MKTGIEIITDERNRQITKKGYNSEHDDLHDKGELALAASCYAIPEDKVFQSFNAEGHLNFMAKMSRNMYWPFELSFWRPGKRIRELAKAGALIAAEIDRLQRLKK